MTPKSELTRRSRDSGRNITKQRRAILEVLAGTRSHPTATEVYDRVREHMPRMTLATVYRNLRVLQELGLVQEILTGTATRFDATVEIHGHIRCERCGRVSDIPVEELADLVVAAQEHTNYSVTGYDLTFVGVCPDCQENGKVEQSEGS